MVRPQDVWSAWTFSWSAVVTLALGIVLYAVGVVRLWRRGGIGRGIHRWQVGCYAAGIVTLTLALLSPIDALGETLFSAHMVQHLLLILVAAPLVVAGAPLLPVLFALPLRWRRRVGRWWRPDTVLGAPVLVFLAHMVAVWGWHMPAPYAAALRHESVHVLEHASFFVTSALLWWFVIQPIGRRRWSWLTAAMCLTLTLMQSGALGALMQFSRTAWYPEHAAGAALWHLTALEDQQLAGLIMAVPAGIVYILAAVVSLVHWFDGDVGTAPTSFGPPREAALSTATRVG